MKTKQITVFASGSGSNFKALHQAALSRDFPARITALMSNNPRAGALEYARKQNIRTYLISSSDFPGRTDLYVSRLKEIIAEESPDLIALAGYLKKIPKEIIDTYPGIIVNIHPSLLPKYGGKGCFGMHVHRAVIENGEKVSGCSVHLVTKNYDEGKVLAQEVVPVEPDDTAESLSRKILEKEHELYPKVIKQLLADRENE